ncbi:MAG TPA: type II CAAX endopeptidase family protein [Gemmatimonadaceae bacterium]|nr:type II CAAX endopeptidase family protein [Gemmatimonadaceae bacterium]
MNAIGILLTPERKLRAPWKLLLFVAALMAALVLTSGIESAVEGFEAAKGYVPLVSNWGVPLGTLIATAVMIKWVEGTGWSYVWLGRHALATPQLVRGMLWGLLAIAIPSGVLLAARELSPVATQQGSWMGAAALTFANLLPAAFGEELLLRGYVFAVLKESIGWRWTLIATSIVFGLLHVNNPGSDPQSIGIVMLAGFFLGSILLATRSLYATTLAHFGWNWFMAAGLHTAVSGIPVQTPDYQVVDSGPDWLTGGSWGPEGGLAAAFGMFVILIYLHARPLRRMES